MEHVELEQYYEEFNCKTASVYVGLIEKTTQFKYDPYHGN